MIRFSEELPQVVLAWGETLADLLATFLLVFVVSGVVSLLYLLWYLWAMARLFPHLRLPAGAGWIPLVNEWRLISRAGLPGWITLLYLIPGLFIVPVVLRTIAQHRIGREVGAGGGHTVVGLFIPPLWAMLIANRFRRQTARAGNVTGMAGAAAAGGVLNAAAASNAPWSTHAPAAPPGAPWAPAATVPVAAAAPLGSAEPATPPHSPLSRDALPQETEAEYARLAAQSFQAPPAVPFATPLAPVAPKPFSWTAATRDEPAPQAPPPVPPPVHPAAPAAPAAPPVPAAPTAADAPLAPAASPAPTASPAPAGHETATRFPEISTVTPKSVQQRASGITAKYDPLPPVARATEIDDLDLTIISPKSRRVPWFVVLPDGTKFELAADTIVGRRPSHEAVVASADAKMLALPDSTRTLSKVHARLRFYDGEWTVEDLGSTNGVFVFAADGADTEIEPYAEVKAGFHLMLGTLEVRLQQGSDARDS